MAGLAPMAVHSGPPSIRSFAPTPNAPTPPLKAAANAQIPQVNSSTFTAKLRRMLNSDPSATFVVDLTIHELGNVPQLGGQFDVKYKFRGMRPHDADQLLAHPASRREIVNGHHPIRPSVLRSSTSNMSLRTASTSSTGTSTPSPSWMVNRVVVPQPLHIPNHSTSLPSPITRSSSGLLEKSHDRKATDPTPLRQSTKPDDTDSCRLIVEEPTDFDSSSIASDSITHDRSSIVPTLVTDDSAATQSIRSFNSSQVNPSLGPEASTPSLDSASLAPSDSLRAPSRASQRSETSTTPRSVLRGHTMPVTNLDFDSTERKGTTPMRSIRAHKVTWEYKVQRVVNIALGKKVDVAQSRHSKHPKQQRPILGGGPLSDSGLKLEIHQAAEQRHGKHPADTLFGYVNVDLAPFADLGPTTRKFLLKGSKTNATIRVTIDMRYIGGQEDWVAPQLTDGHLVQGIAELAGDDYTELQLRPTSSSVSSNSEKSAQSARPSNRSQRSNSSVNKLIPTVSAAVHANKHRYRTYEHHLLPEHGKQQPRRAGSISANLTSPRNLSPPSHTFSVPPSWAANTESLKPTQSVETSGLAPRLIPAGENKFTASPISAPTLLPVSNSPPSSPNLSPVSSRSDRVQGSFSAFGSGLSPTSSHVEPISPLLVSKGPRGSAFANISPVVSRVDGLSPTSAMSDRSSMISPDLPAPVLLHQHHSHFLRDDDRDDMQPDLVIENIFNPIAAEEDSPFTYIADATDHPEVEEDYDDLPQPLPTSSHTAAAAHPSTWKRLRQRVLSNPHHCS